MLDNDDHEPQMLRTLHGGGAVVVAQGVVPLKHDMIRSTKSPLRGPAAK